MNDAAGPAGRSDLGILRGKVDARLAALVDDRSDLGEVMRYALLAPGKRLRPLLTMLAAHDLGAGYEPSLDLSCSLEMVHAASLILDDLPCMDDAMWRRGRPATHVRFGEDVAVLASIALISRAQEVAATCSTLSPEIRCQAVAIIGRSVGAAGLAGGQLRDLRGDRGPDPAELAGVNDLKTGSLFVAAVQLGCAAAGGSQDDLDRLTRFATHLGQAFQILDDLADAEEIAADRSDRASGRKPTLPSVLGRADATARLRDHVSACRALLEPSGKLAQLVGHVFDDAMASRTAP